MDKSRIFWKSLLVLHITLYDLWKKKHCITWHVYTPFSALLRTNNSPWQLDGWIFSAVMRVQGEHAFNSFLVNHGFYCLIGCLFLHGWTFSGLILNFKIGKAEKSKLSLLVPTKCVRLSTRFRIFQIYYFHPCFCNVDTCTVLFKYAEKAIHATQYEVNDVLWFHKLSESFHDNSVFM